MFVLLTSRPLTLMTLHSCFLSIWMMCFCPKTLSGCSLICNSNLKGLSFARGWLRDKGHSLDQTAQEIQMTSFISYWSNQTGTSKMALLLRNMLAIFCYVFLLLSFFILIVMTTLTAFYLSSQACLWIKFHYSVIFMGFFRLVIFIGLYYREISILPIFIFLPIVFVTFFNLYVFKRNLLSFINNLRQCFLKNQVWHVNHRIQTHTERLVIKFLHSKKDQINWRRDKFNSSNDQVTTKDVAIWEAISVKSGMSSRLVIQKSIAMVEFIDWWLKMSIAVIEINDWWLRLSIAIVQKAIE